MPGQIKIDDGAGNYTILTNAGSLGSDKTITIPNTTGTMALTSDISAGGLTAAQQWQLTANITTTGVNDITTNLATPTTSISGQLGSLVSESSGIFSFSETGIYGILVYSHASYNQDGAYAQVYVKGTNDNFSTETRLATTIGKGRSSTESNSSVFLIVDIQDTANDKIKFQSDITTNGFLKGYATTGNANTSFVFMKLGET